jgi:hypothetical protein
MRPSVVRSAAGRRGTTVACTLLTAAQIGAATGATIGAVRADVMSWARAKGDRMN